jgi:branched-chain amino acid transport system ATP-binding protein
VSLLAAKNITKEFGGVRALHEVNIDVEAGTVHAIIGPNGAGKTTFFNVITGLIRPDTGEIFFNSIDITNLKPHSITKTGIARTFQTVRIFPEMTCIDNVKLALHCRSRLAFIDTFLTPPFYPLKQESKIHQKAKEFLEIVDLSDFRNRSSGELNLIEQRKLEIARALATEPKLFFLDEPTAGMDPADALKVHKLIGKLKETGLTIVLIAHDLKLVMESSDRITVLNFGRKIAEGDPREIRNNPLVVEAYFGKD